MVSGPGQVFHQANGQRICGFVQNGDTSEHFAIGDMDDQRIEMRTVFRLENPCDCEWIQRVPGESVNCLGRHGDDVSSTQDRDGVDDAADPSSTRVCIC